MLQQISYSTLVLWYSKFVIYSCSSQWAVGNQLPIARSEKKCYCIRILPDLQRCTFGRRQMLCSGCPLKSYSFGNPGINIGTLRAYSANPMGVANQMSGIGEWGVATRLTNKTITATPASPPPPITIPPSRLPPLTQKNTPITGPFEKGVMLRWKGACPPR